MKMEFDTREEAKASASTQAPPPIAEENATRAKPLVFALEDASEVQVDAPSIDQVQRAIALDDVAVASGTLLAASLQRRVQQAMILCEKSRERGAWIRQLDADQVAQVLQSVMATVHGIDPELAVDLAAALKKKALAEIALQRSQAS